MDKRISIFTVLAMVIMLTTMIACGGGGGGSESVGYTGETMPAIIDTTQTTQQAAVLAWGIVEYAQSGEDYADSGIFPLASGNSVTLNNMLDPERVTQFLYDVLPISSPGGASIQPLSEDAVPLAYQCINVPSTAGSDSGFVSGRICGDFDGNDFNSIDYMRANFIDFSNDGVVFMDGTMILDLTGSNLLLNFRDFYFWDSVEDFYLDGSLSVTESPPVTTASYNVFLYDYVVDEGVWLNNLTIVETVYTGYYTLTIDGRIYDVNEGYCDIETIVPLEYDDGAAYPKSGIIKITGANGVSITLNFTGYGVCNVSIDLDGDGTDDVGPVEEWLT